MTRRKQKMSRAKARTGWLAWICWGIVGSIFLFEDTAGGTGWLTLILTSPFWLAFALWPFLWIALKMNKSPEYVESDEDFTFSALTLRVVQKDGVRYLEKDAVAELLAGKCSAEPVALPGGEEVFVRLEDVRREGKSASFSEWLAQMDEVSLVR